MTNDVISLDDLTNALAPINNGFLNCGLLMDLVFPRNVIFHSLQSIDGL